MSEAEITPKSKNGGYIAVIILLLLGLAFMAYLWSSKNGQLNDCKNDNATLQSDMNGMNEMLSGYVGDMSNDLKKDFKNMLSTYDALIAKDASKADSLNAQKDRIQGLIDELETSKSMSARRIFLLNKENETLRGIMKGYVYQIDSLNTANYRLRSNLDSTNRVLTTTSTERDQYKTEAEIAAEQVKKGSKLQAYGFLTEGLKEKLNSMKAPTDRAKSVVQIRASFTIGKNPITEKGDKVVYMQVIDPSGKTMQGATGNVIQTDKGQIAFSDKKNIDYQNESIDLSIYYSLRGETATKGNYKVNIYCQGQLIGSDSFTLK